MAVTRKDPPIQVLVVYWEDASYDDETNAETALGLMKGQACGWLVEDTPEYISIALEWFEDGEYRRILTVPQRMISEIIRIDPKFPVIGVREERESLEKVPEGVKNGENSPDSIQNWYDEALQELF